DLSARLDRLYSDRRSEVSELRNELDTALQRLHGDEGAEVASGWPGRRRQLEAEIRHVREARAAEELRQFARQRAELARAVRLRAVGLGSALGALAGIAAVVLMHHRDPLRMSAAQVLAASGTAILVAALATVYRTLLSTRVRLLRRAFG